ncbi:MAG: DEAD/DEAH box helicase [Acidobacteriaceae bacterium]|nr:DEAD/DEAH box helicase [Acidobacteriaceae bacterium]
MNNFSELTLSSTVHQNLSRNLFTQPTPVQAQAIPAALSGADVVATAQTGTGKTLAFLLPIIDKLLGESTSRSAKALVLSPTRELAIQIAEAFGKLAAHTGLRAAVVVGGLSEQTQLNALRKGAQIVIATPGRLEDFLNRRLIKLDSVETLVLDEADRMLDMGFLPAIEKILGVLPANRQSLFFSATMEKGIQRLIARHSKDPVRIAVGAGETRTPDAIQLHVYEVEGNKKVGLLHHLLDQEDGSFLVFARTKHGTDRLAKKLSGLGVKAAAIHGDRTQNQRNQALAGFREGRYRVLVATDVAARGIHVDSVAHVVNFDIPQAPDDFVHRVGRTGRAGQKGCASTFISKSERGEIRRIERACNVRLAQKPVVPGVLDDEQIRALRAEADSQSEEQLQPVHPERHHHGFGFRDHGRSRRHGLNQPNKRRFASTAGSRSAR